jgi:glutathione S-transferase
MQLVGNLNSPFVRRVAVSLNALQMPFELKLLIVSKQPEAVREFNPIVRIPVLTLDDGEVLIDSSAILDEIDQIVGPERALVPPGGPMRRDVLRICSVALGAMEKTMWALYERRFRPPEKVHEPWIERNDQQVLGGLRFLDGVASKPKPNGWLAGHRMTQADITSCVAYTFAALNRPALDLREQVPRLASFAARCERLQMFTASAMPPPTL